MIQIRRSGERGYADHGWLKSFHTFSFADYFDPNFMGFRSLRVINEDFVEGGEGFGTHPHRDMEIVTYVLEGALEHKDSMGTGSVIRPGEVQYMSAGTGVTHSEFNASAHEKVHLLQIWILPDQKGHTPRYAQKSFNQDSKAGKLKLIVSPEGREGSIEIHQDARIWASVLSPGEKFTIAPEKGRYQYLQIARGAIRVNGIHLSQGDGAAIGEEKELTFESDTAGSEFLLFDLH